MYFNPGDKSVSLKNLIKAMHNPGYRALWDKDVEYGEVSKLQPQPEDEMQET